MSGICDFFPQMSRKRSLLTDMFRQVKRPRVAPPVGQVNGLMDGKEGKSKIFFFVCVWGGGVWLTL